VSESRLLGQTGNVANSPRKRGGKVKRLVIWIMLLALLTPTVAMAAEIKTIHCPEDGRCIGTDAPERFLGQNREGNRGWDKIQGEGGNDQIYGRAGTWDDLHAGDGDDAVYGGPGRNYIWGDAGTDTLEGGRLSDRIVGGPDKDTVTAGGGGDNINLRDGQPGDRVVCGKGLDKVNADVGDRVADDCEMGSKGR
jgi:Ca2+-binding RTX toxin-like protein